MSDVRSYLLAAGVGLLVGVIYAALGVRSPAPPVVALVGLLGILLGEQIPPLLKRVWAGELSVAAVRADSADHVLGPLPARPAVCVRPVEEP